MSKSLGNGIDPLEVIDQYGADALRFTLATGNSPGNDMRFSDDKVEASRNFANKLWNAARFILMNLDEPGRARAACRSSSTLEDQWILSASYNTPGQGGHRESGKVRAGHGRVRSCTTSSGMCFCDWYIELCQDPLARRAASRPPGRPARCWCMCMTGTLELLHPFMPFVTEEIWQALPHEGEALDHGRPWPEYEEGHAFPQAEAEMKKVMELITAVRTRRSEMNVPPSKKAHLYD